MPKPKKDFTGKNKTSKTYDADWVFRNGAWVTKRQARAAHEGERQNKEYLAGIHGTNVPVPTAPGTGEPPAATPPTLTAPILGGILNDPNHIKTYPPTQGGLGPKGPGWTPQPKPGVGPNPPTWWINQAIQNPTTEDQKFANMANALLPTLAPEDQRTLATYLAQNYKDVYGGYANTQFSPAPTELNAEWRKAFLSPERAQLAVSLLDKMKTASGGADLGAGYDFLKNAVNLMNQFASGGVMTREQYQQFTNAVSNLGKNATGDLAPYGNLAQLFNLPSFSAGPLVSNTPNKKLFS